MEEPLPDNKIIKEIKMFFRIALASILFFIFAIGEDAIVFKLGRGTDIPFIKVVVFIILPLSILFGYIDRRFLRK